jgi:PLP dependent protein
VTADSLLMSIAENIAWVQERIAAAARRSGRRPEEISLMAVSKTFPVPAIRQAYDAGVRLFGENRVQEFAGKYDELRGMMGAARHLIGHLQSNKAGKAAELFSAVDSVDSLKLAERLNAAAEKLGQRLGVLIEVNIGGEENKSGVDAGGEELRSILAGAQELRQVEVHGLMAIPPFADDPQESRHHFRKLRELRDALEREKFPTVRLDVLSMGMSGDFEVAIEEGSTCVRVGTAIFGERKKD